MVVYAVILFATAVVFSVFSLLIYKGKTELIHDYHQANVEDKSAYGKAFSKVLGVMAATMALSGAVALFGEDAIWGAVAILLAGFIVGIVAITRVQKKYNGGVF